MMHVPYHSQQEFDAYDYQNDSVLPVLQSMLDWYKPPWKYPATVPTTYTPNLLMQRMGVLNNLTDHMTPYDFVLLADFPPYHRMSFSVE